jgi:hypothetical protein
MSVVGYLVSKTLPEVRMPRCPSGIDELGIRWAGEVLQGRIGVTMALQVDRGGKVAGGEKLRDVRGVKVGWK